MSFYSIKHSLYNLSSVGRVEQRKNIYMEVLNAQSYTPCNSFLMLIHKSPLTLFYPFVIQDIANDLKENFTLIILLSFIFEI